MHPYQSKPDYQFWKRAAGIDNPGDLDPVVTPRLQLRRDDKIMTGGSCFAQHIAKRLQECGFDFLVTEPAHPLVPPELHVPYNYGIFTARYGNIYTARQLLQLLRRSYGEYEPLEAVWRRSDGAFADPFRPNIQPQGFASRGELLAERQVHFAAVRRAVESATVLVFTLGLTEAWVDRRDGAVFPLAPGVAAGEFDPETCIFYNFGVPEVVEDMVHSFEFMRTKNPNLKAILTVSPVPLNATALPRHVLVSTTYSKAVLRVAADQVCARLDYVEYFPSYEIITSPHARGRYFGPDCRAVTKAGVDHVMAVFLKHYAAAAETGPQLHQDDAHLAHLQAEAHLAAMQEVMQVVCDEESISNR